MTKTAVRGTKRWCQDVACALPFYDLNRADFSCPNCGAAYDIRLARSLAVPSQPPPVRFGRPAPAMAVKPEPEAEPDDVPEEDEAADGDAGAAETLIEDDEDEGDVPVPRAGGDISE